MKIRHFSNKNTAYLGCNNGIFIAQKWYYFWIETVFLIDEVC